MLRGHLHFHPFQAFESIHIQKSHTGEASHKNERVKQEPILDFDIAGSHWSHTAHERISPTRGGKQTSASGVKPDVYIMVMCVPTGSHTQTETSLSILGRENHAFS